MKRHALTTRLWHWINAAALIVLFMSGLNISNAHRYLYWGNYGFDPSQAWAAVMRFPGWATLPQRYDLAEARDWHFIAAWVFAVGLLVMWIVMLANRHFQRDLATSPSEWAPANLWREVKEHLRGHFDGDHGIYNSLQKMTYGIVLGIMLPLMVVTGLAISPGFEPSAPWLIEALGGRQTARSLHFIVSWALFAFFVVHIILVLVSGPIGHMRAMIFGGTRQEKTT